MPVFIWGSFIACVLFAAAVFLLRRAKPLEGELLRLRESPAVAVLGIVVLVFCLVVGLRLSGGQVQATELVLFSGVGMVLGCVSLLWYLVRCTIVTEDAVVAVGLLGGQVTLRWGEIVRLKLENGRLLLLDFAGRQCTVAGGKKELAAFAAIARKRLKPGVGAAVLTALEQKGR